MTNEDLHAAARMRQRGGERGVGRDYDFRSHAGPLPVRSRDGVDRPATRHEDRKSFAHLLRATGMCTVLFGLGFSRRVRGSHHIFTRDGIRDILNLQPRRGGEAKPYQVRQVRDVVVRYGLAIQLSLDKGADDEA